MPGAKFLSAILIMVPGAVLLTAEASLGEPAPAAEQCKASPGGAAPRGMHWYYRINRATNKHCWYLGPVGHLKSHTAATAVSDQAATRKINAADAETAAPAPAMTADNAETAATPSQPSAMQPPLQAPAQAASAQAAPQAVPAPQVAAATPAAGDPHFGARWPENLPNAEELEQSEPAPVGNGSAERRDAGASAQVPAAASGRAAQTSTGETVLDYVSIAGIFLIPLLLAAGFLAKFAHESHDSVVPDWLRTMADKLRRRRETFVEAEVDAAAFAEDDAPIFGDETVFEEAALHDEAEEAAFHDEAEEAAHQEAAFVGSAPPISPALAGRRADADWRARTPTDPAQDLKRSLAELMHDLRRAAEPEEPARHARRSYDRADERVLSPSLQPAE